MNSVKAACALGLLGLGLTTASASAGEFGFFKRGGHHHHNGWHGGGSSGGAPSPEVNVALGLAIASGTVAFLRRRKKNAAKSDA